MDVAHPRFGTEFTEKLELAARALKDAVHEDQKPGRLGGCQREVQKSHKTAVINRNIQVDLLRLRNQLERSVDEEKSVWHNRWPHPAAIEGQCRAAEELALKRRPVIDGEKK